MPKRAGTCKDFCDFIYIDALAWFITAAHWLGWVELAVICDKNSSMRIMQRVEHCMPAAQAKRRMHSMIVFVAHLQGCRRRRWPFGCCRTRHLPHRRCSYRCQLSRQRGAAKSWISQKIVSMQQTQRLPKETRRWSKAATSERARDASTSTVCGLQSKIDV